MNKTFYGKDKGGKYKVWSIEAKDGLNGDAYLVINHGQEGGKQTEKVDYFGYGSGKQGRSALEQAISEAEGRIKKQVDKGYREDKADLEELPLLPMLAGDYRKIGHRIDWENGVHVPDKFDGVRCLIKCDSFGAVSLESRTGQPYSVPHIEHDLALIMRPHDVLDAELYVHGYCLEDITSAVKREDTQAKIDAAQKKVDKHNATGQNGTDGVWFAKWEELMFDLQEAELIHEIRPQLQVHVFDLPSDKPWYQRWADLIIYARDRFFGDFVILAENPIAFSIEEMKVLHKDAVRRGFEGVMLRNKMGMYESGKRSADLQKYKEFVDEEFEILDLLPAKDDGSVYLLKNNLNENTFTCTMGDMPERLRALREKMERIGKYMNVKFQARYKKSRLPQFPTGEYIRAGVIIDGQFVPTE